MIRHGKFKNIGRRKRPIMSGQRGKKMVKESQYLQREKMTRERAFQELEKVNNIACCQRFQLQGLGSGHWV